MKKPSHTGRRIGFWLLAGLVLIGLLAWAFWPKPIPIEAALVQQGPYQQTIIEEGKTRAREIYQISSPVSGNLKRIELHPGDKVKVGDLLAEVDWPRPWQVRSPVAGSILRIHQKSGGPIERGVTIMEVANPSLLEIVSEILTTDAVQIKPEASVRISDWGGCQDLQGTVRIIEPGAFTKTSALGIEEQRVKVITDITSFQDECGQLADGYRVNTHITTYQTENTLTIPTGSLFREGEDWAVFQVIDGRAVKTKIKVARRNPERAMIEGGLKQGDQVIVYPSDEITEGVRVRALNKVKKAS